jgi:membrane protease subunit (stomatin/prohibitin family)
MFGFIRDQLIDVIEFLDNSNNTIVHRYDRKNNEIKYGAQLIVRESQVAVFINEGQLADVFSPGHYTLETGNMPVLTTLKSWKYGFNSPFKAEVYFINTKLFSGIPWGTKNPIMLRDPDFGAVRIRAFGTFGFKIAEPAKFLRDIVGTDGHYTVEEIEEKLKSIIVTRFTDAVGESKVAALDIAARYDELSELTRQKLMLDTDKYGLGFPELMVENISLPEEVEAAIDKRAQMGILGNMDQYSKFTMANSMEKAAENGGFGEFMTGANNMQNMQNQQQMQQMQMMQQMQQMQMMQNMANNVGNQNQQNPYGNAVPPPPPAAVAFHIFLNGQQAGPFQIPQLMQMMQTGQFAPNTMVWKQGMPGWVAAAQVPELASLFGGTPPPPPPPMG